MREHIAFVLFPYAAAVIFLLVPILRLIWSGHLLTTSSPVYRDLRRSWAAGRPLSLGILGLTIAYLAGLLFPAHILLWNRVPLRLFLLEGMGLALGVFTLAGFILLLRRRRGGPRTGTADLVALTLVAASILSGLAVALTYRWASNLYAVALVPYLHSLAAGAPRPELVTETPILVRFHVLTAFGLLTATPFTKLVYLAAPALDGLRRAASALRAPLGRETRLNPMD